MSTPQELELARIENVKKALHHAGWRTVEMDVLESPTGRKTAYLYTKSEGLIWPHPGDTWENHKEFVGEFIAIGRKLGLEQKMARVIASKKDFWTVGLANVLAEFGATLPD